MITDLCKTALLIFLLITSLAYPQPVATSGDGLLLSGTATEAQVFLGSDPLFLDTQPASMPYFPASDPAGTSLRIISSLFAIIILAFAVSWFIQKKVGFGSNVFGKVLGILPLDNRRMIYLVDVMGRVLILGVTEANINHLGEITDKDTLDSLRLQYNQPSPGMEKLFAFLKSGKKTSNESDATKTAEEEASESVDAHKIRQQERLRKLNDMLLKRD